MDIIKKIHRLSDLPELSNVKGSKLIVAFNKKNYVIDSSLIEGKKILNITERYGDADGGRNTIIIRFSDGTTANLYVYNGTKGDTGAPGLEGDKGNTGEAATADLSRIRDAKDVLKIVNDYVSNENDNVHDSTCEDAWSAYRGKYTNDKLDELSETFISDAEYEVLWNEDVINYMVAEYTTTEEDHNTIIFSNDTNSHKVYKKFWTYEEGDVATYYVAIYGPLVETDEEGVEHPVLDEHGDPVIGIVRYDPVVANIWDDIYLGDTEGYFPATTSQLNDLSTLYVYDSKDKKYKEIDIDTVQENVEIIDGNTVTTPNESYKDKDFDFYSEGMEEYLHAHYTNTTNVWTYSFDDATPFKKPLYKEDTAHPIVETDEDGNETVTYNLIEVGANEELQPGAKYFYANDKSTLISDVNDYLAFSEERCYLKKWNEAHTAYEWVEQEYITKYTSAEEREEYLESLRDKGEEFITLSINRIDRSYTFERQWPTIQKKQTIYHIATEVYQDGNLPQLYSYFEKREYYTGQIKTVTHEDNTETYETVYTKINIPTWIVAEYTTTYEDETAVILNNHIEEGGKEDNTVIDITAEDYEDIEDIEIVPVRYIAYTDMEPIYSYNSSTNEYDEVSFENIDYTRVTPYYKLIGEWITLTGEEAMAEPTGTKLYYLDSYGEKQENSGAIDSTKTYYKWSYEAKPIVRDENINDIENFIKKQDITIFTGIPKQLPISFVPNNATYKFAKIEYDSDIVTLFEDGRICAIGENLDENNETHTTLTITPIDPETEHQTGKELILNITVLTPMNSILIENNGEAVTTTENSPIYINRQEVAPIVEDEDENEDEEQTEEQTETILDETIKLDYIVAPLTTSNKKIELTISDDTVLKNSYTYEKLSYNTTSVTFTGLKQGKVLVSADSKDGFGANAKCWIEVVEPVTDVQWDTTTGEGKPKVDKVTYTQYDVEDYMIDNLVSAENVPFKVGDFKEYVITLLKDVPYRYMPTVTPEDASYPELVWESSNTNIVTVERKDDVIIDSPEVLATEEDVDNGAAKEVGDVIKQAVTHTELMYQMLGKQVTTKDGYEYDSNGQATKTRVSVKGHLKNVYGKLAEDDKNKHEIQAFVIVNQSVETITISLVEGLTLIDLDDASLSLNVGTSKKLVADLEPKTAVTTFNWRSSDESIITIDEDGILKAKKPGLAKIFVDATDGSGKTKECNVVVTVPATNIDLVSTNETNESNGIVYVGRGSSTKITALIEYAANANATEETKFGVNWTTSDPTIAKVSEGASNRECVIEGVKLGTTTIIAKAKDNSGTLGAVQVVVIESVESIEFETTEYTLDVNDLVSLMPKFTPENSTNQVLTWTSSDETKAVVNSSGIVTALAPTDVDDENKDIPVVITATTTDGSNKSATCNIKIN